MEKLITITKDTATSKAVLQFATHFDVPINGSTDSLLERPPVTLYAIGSDCVKAVTIAEIAIRKMQNEYPLAVLWQHNYFSSVERKVRVGCAPPVKKRKRSQAKVERKLKKLRERRNAA